MILMINLTLKGALTRFTAFYTNGIPMKPATLSFMRESIAFTGS